MSASNIAGQLGDLIDNQGATIVTLASDIIDLKSKSATQESRIANLEARLASLEQRVANLESIAEPSPSPEPEPSPEPLPEPPSVSLDGLPNEYTIGSDTILPIEVVSFDPQNHDLLLICWHHDQNLMVQDFAHVMNSGPWQIDSAKMDTIPAGRANIQAIIRDKGSSEHISKSAKDITIVAMSDNPLPPTNVVINDGRFNGIPANADIKVVSDGDSIDISSMRGTADRPIVFTGDPNTRTRVNRVQCLKGDLDHVYFVGLDIAGDSLPVRLLSGRGPITNVTFEDCVIRDGRNNVELQSRQGYDFSNITFNRCIVIDAHSSSSHSQGLYAHNISNMTISECVFDHNGWKEGVAERTIYNHNIYLQHNCDNVSVISSVLSRGSSHGLQLRCRGEAINNLLIKNAIGMHACGSDGGAGTIRGKEAQILYNVIMLSDDIGSRPRGMGLEILRSKFALCKGQVILERLTGPKPGIQINDDEPFDNTHIELIDNIVHNWGDGIFIHDRHVNEVVRSNNIIDGVVSETGQSVSFVDPSVSIDKYISGGFEAFINVARSRGRGEWDRKYSSLGFNEYIRSGFTVK